MSAHVQRELLTALVDGELDHRTREHVEAHVAQCADCRTVIASDRALKHGVAHLEGQVSPPAAVRARIDSLALRSRSARAHRRWVFAALAGGATLAVATAAMVLLWPSPSESLGRTLVADHLHSVPAEKPPDVASSDAGEVRGFFVGRVPFDPVVPKIPQTRLLGGRLCSIKDRRVELLFYERQKQTLSLFVGPSFDGTRGCERAMEHSVCYRRDGALALMLVGRLPPHEAQRLLQQAQLSGNAKGVSSRGKPADPSPPRRNEP